MASVVLAAPTPRPRDDDRDHRHFGRLGAVGFGGVDRERLQSVGDHRDHAVARFLQQPLIDRRPSWRARRSASALSAASPADHDVLALAAGAVDDGDGLLLGRRGLLGRGLGAAGWRAGGAVAAFSPRRRGRRIAMRATGSPPSGLSPKMAKPAKTARNRPSSTASAWIPVNGSRKRRFRRAVSCPSGVLRSSAVSAMDLPESTDSTIPRRGKAAADAPAARAPRIRVRTRREPVTTAKRAARRPPCSHQPVRGSNQFATLLAGLSIAALSPVGAVALTLTPCSRSAAIFSALSSLASGGT